MSKKDEDGDEHEHAKVGLRVLDEGTSKLSSQWVGRYRWSADWRTAQQHQQQQQHQREKSACRSHAARNPPAVRDRRSQTSA